MSDEFMRHLSFGEWANDVRTQTLMKMNARIIERMIQAEACADALQDKINARDEQVSEMQQRIDELESRDVIDDWSNYVGKTALASHEAQIEALRNELRQSNSLNNLIRGVSARRYKKILDLENRVKVNGEFIELQGSLLRKARSMIQRLCMASGLHVPDESALDL
jgi:uncharacterized membrane protein YccC